MVIVTLQREKCIGCGYCVEAAGEFFSMSEKDGKSILNGAAEKKGFHTLKTGDETATISRVNRSLNYGNDGYDMVFERIDKK